MLKQTLLNPLKKLIDAALSDGKTAPAEPSLPAQLSAVGHFLIPEVADPPEGWVYVEDGRLKRFDDLTDFERDREALLQPLAREWMEHWLAIADLSARFDEAFDVLDELAAPRKTARAKAGLGQSVTRFLLDRSVSLARKRADVVRYDEDKLLAAKKKVDACVERFSIGGRKEIKQLAELSFTKNTKGEYSRSGMVRLRRLESDDPEWHEAMDLIKKAELVDGMASYKLVSVRDRSGKYHPLPLDIASVRPWRRTAA